MSTNPTYRVIAPNGEQSSPADVALLSQWVREGRIHPQTLLFEVETSRTLPAQSLPELRAAFDRPAGMLPAGAPPPLPPSLPASPPKKKLSLMQVIGLTFLGMVLWGGLMSANSGPHPGKTSPDATATTPTESPVIPPATPRPSPTPSLSAYLKKSIAEGDRAEKKIQDRFSRGELWEMAREEDALEAEADHKTDQVYPEPFPAPPGFIKMKAEYHNGVEEKLQARLRRKFRLSYPEWRAMMSLAVEGKLGKIPFAP